MVLFGPVQEFMAQIGTDGRLLCGRNLLVLGGPWHGV